MDLHVKNKIGKANNYQFYFDCCTYCLEKIVLLELVCYAASKIHTVKGNQRNFLQSPGACILRGKSV